MATLESMQVPELKKMLKAKGVKGFSKMTKEELVKAAKAVSQKRASSSKPSPRPSSPKRSSSPKRTLSPQEVLTKQQRRKLEHAKPVGARHPYAQYYVEPKNRSSADKSRDLVAFAESLGLNPTRMTSVHTSTGKISKSKLWKALQNKQGIIAPFTRKTCKTKPKALLVATAVKTGAVPSVAKASTMKREELCASLSHFSSPGKSKGNVANLQRKKKASPSASPKKKKTSPAMTKKARK